MFSGYSHVLLFVPNGSSSARPFRTSEVIPLSASLLVGVYMILISEFSSLFTFLLLHLQFMSNERWWKILFNLIKIRETTKKKRIQENFTTI